MSLAQSVVWFGSAVPGFLNVFNVLKQHPTAICERFSAPLPPQWSEQVDETSSRVGWPNESAVFGGLLLMPLDVFPAGGSGMKAETEHFGILMQNWMRSALAKQQHLQSLADRCTSSTVRPVTPYGCIRRSPSLRTAVSFCTTTQLEGLKHLRQTREPEQGTLCSNQISKNCKINQHLGDWLYIRTYNIYI